MSTAVAWIAAGVALVLVLAAAYFVIRMLVARRQAGGAARLASTLHLNARWWREQEQLEGALLYVAVGDSTAQGVGASRPGRSYVGLIADRIRHRTRGTVRVVNLSVSGARLREAIAVQVPKLAALRESGVAPDLCTCAIGANDIASFDARRFARELRTLYEALPPGTVVGDVPSFYIGAAERKVLEANVIVNELAREFGFEVAPVYARTRRQGVSRYALRQVAADFFHPNDRGYRVWASAFFPVVDRVAHDTDGGLA